MPSMLIACPDVSQVPTPAPGSAEVKCAACDTPIVACSQSQEYSAGGAYLVCCRCVISVAKAISAEQRKAFRVKAGMN